MQHRQQRGDCAQRKGGGRRRDGKVLHERAADLTQRQSRAALRGCSFLLDNIETNILTASPLS